MSYADTVLKHFPSAWALLDGDCLITSHNAKFAKLLQVSGMSLVGNKVTGFWQSDCRHNFRDHIDQLTHSSGELTKTVVTLDLPGRPIDLLVSGWALPAVIGGIPVVLTVESALSYELDAMTSLLGTMKPRSDSAEMLLRQGESLVQSWVCSANTSAEELWGQPKDVLTKGTLETAVRNPPPRSVLGLAEKAFMAGEPFQETYKETGASEQVRHIEWHLTPVDSQAQYWLDRRWVSDQEEEAKQPWHKSGRTKLDTHFGTDVGIISWDLVTNEMETSRRLILSLGYDPETIGDPIAFFTGIYHPVDLVETDKLIQNAILKKIPYKTVVRVRAKDGRYRSILYRGQPLMDENGTVVKLVGTETDITEQVELSTKLLRAEHVASVGSWSRRLGEDKMEWSPELYSINGVTPDTFNPSLKTVQKNVHPDDLALVVDGEQRVLGKWRQNPDMVDRVHVRITHPDGKIRFCEICTMVEVDAQGAPFELVGTIQDRTDLVEAEQRLQGAQKMEVVGQMAGGAAHDFNNLLAVVMGTLELLEDEEDPKERAEFIQIALSATRRGGDLTRSLLSFARQAVLNPRNTDLNVVLMDLQKVLHRILPGNINLMVKANSDLWTVHVDKSTFENAVLNLAINARDAMPDGGMITIEAENKALTERQSQEHQETLDPGLYVVFSLADTGSGISDDLMQEVFRPYFSTKSKDQGSGLGLSMVHGFARQSGGGLRLMSQVGVGTTIKLYFPASEKAASVGHTEQVAPHGPISGKVLLVDDSEEVRKIMKRRLESIGLTCTVASCGDEAAKIHVQLDGFDLLVTDIVMPGALQGPDLARLLRKMQPDLKVVFITGYANQAVIHGDGLRPEDLRLMKPVSRKELTQAVHDVIRS